MKNIEYKGFIISYWAKPIPDRRWDYDAVHNDYDGPGDDRCFSGSSVEDVKAQIDDYYMEEA